MQTRSSSAAVFCWSGANIAPKIEIDDVEAAVLEGQVLGVGLDELDLEALGGRPLAAALEQGRDVVGADRVAPGAPRRRDRAVAAAAGDVEHALVGDDVERLGEVLGALIDDAGDHREVALRPDLLLDLR